MAKLSQALLGFFSLIALAGCGQEAVKPEPAASTEQSKEAASNWTPEQKAAFEKAHADARSGADAN